MKTVQLIIDGRVQGVYFRVFTQKQAAKLGITGFVCNKKNGSVEIVARAHSESLEAFISWCHKGPLLAKVKSVAIKKDIPAETFTKFEIR
jgi:acylphosphatase